MSVSDQELVERMRAKKSPTAALLGLQLESLDSANGKSRFSMKVEAKYCNPMGTLQGGIATTALDDAAATAIIARSGRRVGVPTIEFKVSFFGPAKLGTIVYFEGRVLKLGRSVSFAEADMTDENGKLLARLTTSAMVIDMEGPGLLVEQA